MTGFERVLFLGDSFVTQGGQSETQRDLPEVWATTTPLSTPDGTDGLTGNGFAAGSSVAAAFSAVGTNGLGLVPAFLSRMAELKMITIENVNYAIAGGNWADCETKYNAATATGFRPDLVMIECGTNPNIIKKLEATYQANINSMLTAINVFSPRLIVHSAPLSISNDPVNDATHDTWTDDCNTFLNTLPATVSNLVIADSFNYFGGHTLTSSDFQTNNVHPSEQGSEKLGKFLANFTIAEWYKKNGRTEK